MFEGKLNGAKYRDILKENLFHNAQDLSLGRRFTFQHDNDPIHATQDWQHRFGLGTTL